MKAVILAGGLGTRLSEETDRIPKPMINIGGRPILWHIMKMYSAHGINQFVICLGYKGYLIKEYFFNYRLHMSDFTLDLSNDALQIHQHSVEPWNVTLIDTGQNTQTGGRLRRVRDQLEDETFCFTYGDGVSDIDITAAIAYHRSHGKKATVTAITPPGRYGVLTLEGDQITGFAEKMDSAKSPLNGGFFVLEPSVIDYIDDDNSLWERKPLETLAKDGELMAYRHEGFWQPMDTLREKRILEELWSSGSPPWKVWK